MDRRATTRFGPDQGRAPDHVHGPQSGLANTWADPRDEIERHLASMRAFALVLTGQRAIANDIVARTVVAAWANIDAFSPGSNMRAWLFGMLRTVYDADKSRQILESRPGGFRGELPENAVGVAERAE